MNNTPAHHIVVWWCKVTEVKQLRILGLWNCEIFPPHQGTNKSNQQHQQPKKEMPPREGLPGLDSSVPFSAQPLDHLFLVFHGAGDPYDDHPPWLQSLESCISKLQTNYNLMRSHIEKINRHIPPPTENSTTTTVSSSSSATATPVDEDEPSTSNANPTNSTRLPTALFLPVEWHRSAFETWQSEIRIANPQPLSTSTSTSSQTSHITAIREALSDTIGDIIMMSSPFWRKEICKHIYKQIESQISAVIRNRPSFSGRISILAHSIGCIIALDCLNENNLYTKIDSVFMTGNPISAYAVLVPDNQSALSIIRKLRYNVRFINVFHPLDPVAYRLEPFILEKFHVGLSPVKVEPKRRSFWQDAELFWDDVVYNLCSSLIPKQQQRDDVQQHNEDFVGKVFSKCNSEKDIKRKRALRRSSSYILSSEHDDDNINNNIDYSHGQEIVLLSGRIDYELQDGMSVPPIDVMASWGAIKAHGYYWQSLDVAQMLLDITMTSETAISSRR